MSVVFCLVCLGTLLGVIDLAWTFHDVLCLLCDEPCLSMVCQFIVVFSILVKHVVLSCLFCFLSFVFRGGQGQCSISFAKCLTCSSVLLSFVNRHMFRNKSARYLLPQGVFSHCLKPPTKNVSHKQPVSARPVQISTHCLSNLEANL